MQWVQNYYTVGNSVFLTALCSALPILFLFWALGIKKMKGYLAIMFAWFLTLLTAIIVHRMPLTAALSAAAYGAIQGIFPLCWLAFHALLFYNLIVKSGNFETIKFSISSISNDRRIQAVLIGFIFSAFLEGTTGPGAAMGISAAMLTALGFPALTAITLSLIGNSVPGSFGPAGMPVIVMVNSALSGVPGAFLAVAGSVGGVLSIFGLLVPVLMLIAMCGWKQAKEVFPFSIVTSLCYGIPNLFISRYLGPELPSILSPLAALAGIIVFLKFWKPRTIWRFEGDPGPGAEETVYCSPGKIAYAWSPFILMVLVMVLWALPSFRAFSLSLPFTINISPWPGLHGIVYMAAPIVNESTVYAASFRFDLFAAVGTALLFISFITILIFRMRISVFMKVYIATLKQISLALVTIILVLSIAQLSNYSGISFTLGLAFAATGRLFVVFSPIIGFTGVFLTGSIASSGALFGNLQRISAEQLGLNPIITITANMAGSAMGKLISPQSITIVAASIGLAGREGLILGKMLKYAFLLLGICIVILLILAYVFPGYFPEL